ncbi:cupin domain-containing protein [Massilia cavernae]|nr:cupin domain-containing protein [Massilia cavernae]
MTQMIRFNDIEPKITEQFPDEDKRIKGKPLRTSQEYFANAVHGVRAGTWKAEAGSYRIELADTKHEFFHILTGKVQIALPDGSGVKEYAAGDTGIIPPGFKGIFEIVVPASKFWVVTERS